MKKNISLFILYFIFNSLSAYAHVNKDDFKIKFFNEEGEKYKWHFSVAYLDNLKVFRLKSGWNCDTPQFSKRSDAAKVKYLIIHYTVSNLERSLSLLCSQRGPVSVHYILDKYGNIYDVLDDSLKGFHAGVSRWCEDTGLNDISIGIENVNSGFEDMVLSKITRIWYPFNKEQINSLGLLCRYIIDKYSIEARFVLGHADIAPNRKEDPGPLFPWWYMYEVYGVGAWCTAEDIKNLYDPLEVPQNVDIEFVSSKLYDYGYTCIPRNNNDKENSDYKNSLRAFKAHFSKNQKPDEYEKEADMEDQIYIYCLCKKYRINSEK